MAKAPSVAGLERVRAHHITTQLLCLCPSRRSLKQHCSKLSQQF